MPNIASQIGRRDQAVTTTVSDLLLVLEIRLAQISVFVERCADGEGERAFCAQSATVLHLIAQVREKAARLAPGVMAGFLLNFDRDAGCGIG